MEFKINYENRQYDLTLSNRDHNAIPEAVWERLVTDLTEVVLSYIPEEAQPAVDGVLTQFLEKLNEEAGRQDLTVKARTRPVKLTLIQGAGESSTPT